MPAYLHMLRRSILSAAFVLTLAGPIAAQTVEDIRPEDRVLGPGAEIRLPAIADALAESLASIARTSGVLIGFETKLDVGSRARKTRFGSSLRGKKVSEALDDLMAIHKDYEWHSFNGVIHVRPQSAFADANHFLNQVIGPLELTDALPLHATFEVHRVFVPDCVVNHPIYTDQRDTFLEHEEPAMRQPLTLSFNGGTVLDLLDAVIKAHGALYWNVTYQVPPERLRDAIPSYEYAVFAFAPYPQVGGWWRMCAGRHEDRFAGTPDAVQPPPLVNWAAKFKAVRLSRAPVIDGREWVGTEVQTTSSPGKVALPTQAFSLTATDCGDHNGDFERCQLLLQRGRAAPVRIDRGYTGWVFVTPDGRYVVTEPLYVLDVREWNQYALAEALQISNYTNIEAIAADGSRLLISRRDCVMDCRGDVNVEYYELRLPR
jgi:hypothetical protein